MATRAGLDYGTIVQRAADLANKNGLDALSMASLASELEVSSPALYHYFVGRAGLLRAVTLLGLHQGTAAMGRATQGKAGDEALLALAHALRDFANAYPGLYEAASRAPDPADREWMAVGEEVVGLMLRSLSSYDLSTNDARRVIRMLRSAIHGCVSLERLGGFGVPGVADDTFGAMLLAILDYVHAHLQGRAA
jgi:AcrR family transcriptional regulator